MILYLLLSIIKSEITSKEDFLLKMNKLNSQVSNLDLNYKQQILRSIYDIMGKGNQERFTLFITVSLVNTNYFTKFVDYDDRSIYKKRGLLGIKGENQYKLLSRKINKNSSGNSLINHSINYYDNYEMAGSTMYNVIEDLSFFFDYMLGQDYTIEKYYEVMKLGEIKRMEDRPDVKVMRRIHFLLKKVFNSKLKK